MEYAQAQCNASAEHTPPHTWKPQSAASSWPGASVVGRRGVGSKTAQRIKADLASARDFEGDLMRTGTATQSGRPIRLTLC